MYFYNFVYFEFLLLTEIRHDCCWLLSVITLNNKKKMKPKLPSLIINNILQTNHLNKHFEMKIYNVFLYS